MLLELLVVWSADAVVGLRLALKERETRAQPARHIDRYELENPDTPRREISCPGEIGGVIGLIADYFPPHARPSRRGALVHPDAVLRPPLHEETPKDRLRRKLVLEMEWPNSYLRDRILINSHPQHKLELVSIIRTDTG